MQPAADLEDGQLVTPAVDHVAGEAVAALLVVRRTRRAHPSEGLADRGRVAVERALHQPEQLLGGPPLERVRAQLPGQVLVVGAHPPGHREDDVEQPRHRLGGVEPRLEGPSVAVALERAVGEVQPPVEPVVLDQHRIGLLGRHRRQAAHGCRELAAGAVEQHRRPRVGPAGPPVLGAEGRDGRDLGPGGDDLVDLGGLVGRAPGRGLVGEHDHHVEVGALGGEPAGGRAAQHEAEQVVSVGGVVALGQGGDRVLLRRREPVGEGEDRRHGGHARRVDGASRVAADDSGPGER